VDIVGRLCFGSNRRSGLHYLLDLAATINRAAESEWDMPKPWHAAAIQLVEARAEVWTSG